MEQMNSCHLGRDKTQNKSSANKQDGGDSSPVTGPQMKSVFRIKVGCKENVSLQGIGGSTYTALPVS